MAEPIVGYRAWEVVGGGLFSSRGVVWPSQVPMRAECYSVLYGQPAWMTFAAWHSGRSAWHSDRSVPGKWCGCGIYALKSLKSTGVVPTRLQATTTVVGEVLLWGKVFEHERGWRAEFARPHRLYRVWHPQHEVSMQHVAGDYGVEIVDLPPGVVLPPAPTDPAGLASLMSQLSNVSPGSIVSLGPPMQPRPRRRWGKVAAGAGILLGFMALDIAGGLTENGAFQLAARSLGGVGVGVMCGRMMGQGFTGR